MSCEFTHLDGSYVLGALSPNERLEFEQHLAGCEECSRAVRDLAGLPGLLARVDPEVLENPPVEEPVPETLLPALSRQVRRTRRRRGLVTAGLAAAGVAIVVGAVAAVSGLAGDGTPAAGPDTRSTTTATTGPSLTPPPERAMTTIGHAPVRASVSLAPVAWGTRLDLTCTYAPGHEGYHLPKSVTYALVVRTRDGRLEQIGTWRSTRGRTMRFSAGTSAMQRDIKSVEVTTLAGRPVLRLGA
jgi:putative zinc finger protein